MSVRALFLAPVLVASSLLAQSGGAVPTTIDCNPRNYPNQTIQEVTVSVSAQQLFAMTDVNVAPIVLATPNANQVVCPVAVFISYLSNTVAFNESLSQYGAYYQNSTHMQSYTSDSADDLHLNVLGNNINFGFIQYKKRPSSGMVGKPLVWGMNYKDQTVLTSGDGRLTLVLQFFLLSF